MNLVNHHPVNAQRRRAYTFRRQGWPMGGSPSFEEDLTGSDGNDPQTVQELTDLVQDLRTGNVRGLEYIGTYQLLYRCIVHGDPSQLLPINGSGMSAGSLKYVINHLTAGNHAPNNQHQEGFLKWITQICITIWVYRCDRADWRELKQSASALILSDDFTPSVNDASYLSIIAFVLGGDFDQMLAEYVDAVVWNSKVEFACEIEPLRNIISRERRGLVEFMHLSFSRVMQKLAYCGDRQLLDMGLRLNARLVQLGLDLGNPFGGTQDFERAQYPAAFESTFLEALRAEEEALGFRHNAKAGNGADLQQLDPVPRRYGNGGAVAAAIANLFRGSRQESAQFHLESILRDAMRGIAERRLKIVDAVEELKVTRDQRDHRDRRSRRSARWETDSRAEDELAYHGTNAPTEI